MSLKNALHLALVASSPALAVLPVVASAVAYNPLPPFSPMYETHSSSATDSLYTTNYIEALQAPGYDDVSAAFFVERTPVANSTALLRFWKGSPQSEHVYNTATYPQDQINMDAMGYTFEGVAGYIYSVPMPRTLPLHRLVKWNSSSYDHEHKFTTSDAEKDYLVNFGGWTYDRIQGYVPQTRPNSVAPGQFTGYPYLPPGSHVLTGRCGAADSAYCTNAGEDFRDNYAGATQTGYTQKPANATTQTMDFDVWSPDFFGLGEHLVFGLHGVQDVNYQNVTLTTRTGVGIMFGQTPYVNGHSYESCGDASSEIEMFWVPAFVGDPGGHNHDYPNCPTTRATLQNNIIYHVSISVSDFGDIQYAITGGGGPQPVISQTYNVLHHYKEAGQPFPNSTGWFIAQSTSARENYTVYVDNMNVSWDSRSWR